MAINTNHLIIKAMWITESIKRMSAEERQHQPTKAFGDDYNKLRGHVAELHPDLVDVLPPHVAFDEKCMPTQLSIRYVEIQGFAEKIFNFLIQGRELPIAIKPFGEKLKSLRMQAGLTQRELARAASVSQKSISAWELGRREPDWSALQRLARELRVDSRVFQMSSAWIRERADAECRGEGRRPRGGN